MKFTRQIIILWIVIGSAIYLIFSGNDSTSTLILRENYRDVSQGAQNNLDISIDSEKTRQSDLKAEFDTEKKSEKTNRKDPIDEPEEFDMQYFIFLINKIFPKVGDAGFRGFNETMSHSIPLDRMGKDLRDPECKQKNWKFSTDLKVSVVIPFVNEPWSTLLRTVISVLIKSPKQRILEVILVDDQSHRKYLIKPLERLISSFKLLRLVRTPFNMGVARSRNYGARHALGSMIVFMDSHCEVNVGWLEPLLEAINEDPTRIAVCTKDHIEPSTLHISPIDPKSYQVVFNWHMGAAFDAYHPDILEKYNMTDPIPQASLMGQVVAVNKQYFFGIGGFPDYFDGWGAEDVDLSINSWLCGGGVVKCRCCHITHLQKIRPYKIVNDPKINVRYVAELWLDEFISVFRCTQFSSVAIDSSVLIPAKALKKRLKCRPFKWYLENVYPELEIPEANTTYLDPIISERQTPMRVDRDLTTIRFSVPKYSYCKIHVVGDRIKCRDRCLTFDEESVKFAACESDKTNQMWSYKDLLIRPLFQEDMCLSKDSKDMAILTPCDKNPLLIRFLTQFKANCLK